MSTDTPATVPVRVPRKGRKAALITLADLDQRTRAAQRVNETIRSISADLGEQIIYRPLNAS